MLYSENKQKTLCNRVNRVWFLFWLGLQFNIGYPGFGVPVPLVIVYLLSYVKFTRKTSCSKTVLSMLIHSLLPDLRQKYVGVFPLTDNNANSVGPGRRSPSDHSKLGRTKNLVICGQSLEFSEF